MLCDMQVWRDGVLFHTFVQQPVHQLLQVQQTHQRLTPGKYQFMIVGEHMLQLAT